MLPHMENKRKDIQADILLEWPGCNFIQDQTKINTI